MKLLNGLAFVLTLLVGALCWVLYTFEPNMVVGTPWGLVHLAGLIAVGFALGAAVVGFYVLAGWLVYRSSLRQQGRELKSAKTELESLKKQRVEAIVETPVIPDRQ